MWWSMRRVAFPLIVLISTQLAAGCSVDLEHGDPHLVDPDDPGVALYPQGTSSVCEAVRALVNTPQDAAPALQQCLNAALPYDTVLLPAGRYQVGSTLYVNKPLGLATLGSVGTPPCSPYCHGHCAELVAGPGLYSVDGLLYSSGGAILDHLVFNGNKDGRWRSSSYAECRAFHNRYGQTLQLMGNGNQFRYSVSMNALCGSGLVLSNLSGPDGRSHDSVIAHSYFFQNGIHDVEMIWADGVTIHDAANTVVHDNTFEDNTDIGLVFGGCINCRVERNVIKHSHSRFGSFAAMMLHKWPATSGIYSGTAVENNIIDCHPTLRDCGFGILVGAEPWYAGLTEGGGSAQVVGNVIRNAQQPFAVTDANNWNIYNNSPGQPGFYHINHGRSGLNFNQENVSHPDWFKFSNWRDIPNGDRLVDSPPPSMPIPYPSPTPPPPTAAQLQRGDVLTAHQRRESNNGRLALVMQADCNLVLEVVGSHQLWSTQTAGRGNGCFAVMQHDGNLVVYTDSGVAVWHAGTNGQGALAMVLDDGNFVVYSEFYAPVWQTQTHYDPNPPATRHALIQGDVLQTDQSLVSSNGKYRLLMQQDCNLVLYRSDGRALWSSKTNGKSSRCWTVMQGDGNLVLYDGNNRAWWATYTMKPPGNVAVLQDDGNFVVYTQQWQPLWWTNTVGR